MDKQKHLDEVAKEIEKCKICRISKSGKPVPGEGNPDADVVFMGEAPGKQEAETGRPFIGRSGKLLRSFIKMIDLNEKDVFITSPVKYLPDRGTPTSDDIKHGMVHTQKQIDIINPKVIVLLGRAATEGVLDKKLSVVKEHGRVMEKDGRLYLIALHPAFAIRFPSNREKLGMDFEVLQRLLKS